MTYATRRAGPRAAFQRWKTLTFAPRRRRSDDGPDDPRCDGIGYVRDRRAGVQSDYGVLASVVEIGRAQRLLPERAPE